MSDSPRKKPVRLPCVVCAQPARLHCPPCKTPYCCLSCQKEDWKKRHKKDCKRLAEANAAAEAAAAAKAAAEEAATPPPSPKAKAAPPVVSGPAAAREDVERAKKATAAAAKEKKPSAHNNPLGPACESASRGVFGIDGYLVAREGSGVKEIPRVSPGRIPVTPPSRGVRSSPEGKGVQGILPVPGTGAGVPGVLDTSRTTPEDPFGSWSRLRCSSPVGGNRQGGVRPRVSRVRWGETRGSVGGTRGSVGGTSSAPPRRGMPERRRGETMWERLGDEGAGAVVLPHRTRRSTV